MWILKAFGPGFVEDNKHLSSVMDAEGIVNLVTLSREAMGHNNKDHNY
jgi:hypothetical protein